MAPERVMSILISSLTAKEGETLCKRERETERKKQEYDSGRDVGGEW